MLEGDWSSMMPGESRAGAATLASQATAGICHNCTVLTQSLDEYVSALLTLKQKIIDTDLLLSEYKEKCDELQKSQRESAKLHKELNEVLVKLGPLEQQTAAYEAAATALEETTAALKVYQVKCADADALREENAKALAVNRKLEEALQKAEDAANTHSVDATTLKREKETLESDLRKTQESLRSSLHDVEQLENIKLLNAKTLILNSNLENQLLALEDTNLKQNHTIQDLTSKNISLEGNITVIEEKLTTLEQKFNKETRCSFTQTDNQHKVDKDKVWRLLQEVWCCVNPDRMPLYDHHPPSTSRPPRSPPPPHPSPPPPRPVSPFRNPSPRSRLSTPTRNTASVGSSVCESSRAGGSGASTAQENRRLGRKKKPPRSEDLDQSCVQSDKVCDWSVNVDEAADWSLEGRSSSSTNTPDIWNLLGLANPLPALLSPLPSPLPPDQPVEVEVDSHQRCGSRGVGDDDDDDDGQVWNPPPPEDHVGLSSVSLKASLMAPDKNSLKEVSPERQEMMNGISEGSSRPAGDPLKEPDARSADGIQESQKDACNADREEPEAHGSRDITRGSEQIPEDDGSLRPGSPVQGPPGPPVTQSERTVKDDDDDDDECACVGMNGMTCGDSSEPTPNTLHAEEQEECVHQDQGTRCEEEEDGGVKLGSAVVDVCRRVNPEEPAEGAVERDTGLETQGEDKDDNASMAMFDARNHQDRTVPSSTNTENMAGTEPGDPIPQSADAGTSGDAPTHTLKNTPTSVPSPDVPSCIGKVLTEMGPPLPPVVLPLTATPPKCRKLVPSHGPGVPLPAWSSTEAPPSLQQRPKVPDPEPSLATPSPSNGVPSSPLQFGSATPSHALPVPGRLPSSALNSSSPSASQETSMQMLDTMYPELSAQARTLNILRGNVALGRAASEGGTSPPSVNPITGNKTINSSSTAFTKTQQKAKRSRVNVLLPKSAKRLRLDTCSPDPAALAPPALRVNAATPPKCSPTRGNGNEGDAADDDAEALISKAFHKLHNAYFDVLPVIRSHVFLGRISDVPVLRDEEKSVIEDFALKQSLAEEFMSAILSKIKAERDLARNEILQSHCRVYTGLCRWRGDWNKAHALVYTLLKEDFPEAPKLILFMVTTWPRLLSHASALCRAINVAVRLKADGEILDYLSKYLHWHERPPGDVHDTISALLTSLLEDATLSFQKHARHGDDLCPAAWESIYSLELLCAHLGWKWTHDNIIGKQLWPVMNAWVTQPRPQQTPVRDVCVAAVLRLIGRLGQLGLREKLCTSVQNVAKAINLFGKHGISEGVPWEVQLSAVYTIYDLSPSNPKEALEALASWRGQISESVPSAVTSCITQIASICRHVKTAKE